MRRREDVPSYTDDFHNFSPIFWIFGLFYSVAGRRDVKNEPKPKLLGPDIPRNQGNQTFLAGYPGILPGYPGGARKV